MHFRESAIQSIPFLHNYIQSTYGVDKTTTVSFLVRVAYEIIPFPPLIQNYRYITTYTCFIHGISCINKHTVFTHFDAGPKDVHANLHENVNKITNKCSSFTDTPKLPFPQLFRYKQHDTVECVQETREIDLGPQLFKASTQSISLRRQSIATAHKSQLPRPSHELHIFANSMFANHPMI